MTFYSESISACPECMKLSEDPSNNDDIAAGGEEEDELDRLEIHDSSYSPSPAKRRRYQEEEEESYDDWAETEGGGGDFFGEEEEEDSLKEENLLPEVKVEERDYSTTRVKAEQPPGTVPYGRSTRVW